MNYLLDNRRNNLPNSKDVDTKQAVDEPVVIKKPEKEKATKEPKDQ
jgi:hypothetical protein